MEATQEAELYFWVSSSVDSLEDLLLLSWPGGALHKACGLPWFQTRGPQPGQSRLSQVSSALSLWVCAMRICFVSGHVPSSSGTCSDTSSTLLRFMVSSEKLVRNSHPSHPGYLF